MFTKEQLIFGVLFFIVFAILIGLSYKKDAKLHKRYYKGSLWILLAFIGFIGLIGAIKFLSDSY